MEQLKDIRPIDIIEVNFLSYFIVITVIILSISVFIYFISYKKTNLTKRDKIIKKLKNLNFKNSSHKNFAYAFTVYGKECLKNEYQDRFNDILSQLEHYKYKKTTNLIPKDLLKKMENYIEELI